MIEAGRLSHPKSVVLQPAFLVRVADVVPRFNWAPILVYDIAELIGQFFVTFSLALGLLNAIPCYGLDGQFICRCLVDYFLAHRSAA